jgi:hypothetical protein
MPIDSALMRVLLAFALVGAAACGHNEVFQPGESPGVPPRGGGAFHRITFNAGADLFPSWLADGNAIAYSLEASDEIGQDRCIALFDGEGGTHRRFPCRLAPPNDSVASSDWPVSAADGRLAYVWETLRAGSGNGVPDSAYLYIDDISAPGSPRIAFTFPYVEPGVRLYHTATHLSWLSANTLVAIAVTATVTRDCPSCPFRSVRLGKDVVLFDVGSTPANLSVVPGTTNASSVAAGATGDIYYTVAGDSQVWHRVLGTGATTVVHSFGSTGIARDVQVIGSRLVAVVGGNITYRMDLLGAVQDDSGGQLHVLALGSGVDSVLPDSGVLYRHPALGPLGDRLVVEGWSTAGIDLWFFRLP